MIMQNDVSHVSQWHRPIHLGVTSVPNSFAAGMSNCGTSEHAAVVSRTI